MHSPTRARFAPILALAILSPAAAGGCSDAPVDVKELGVRAVGEPAGEGQAPAGYLFAVNGTHVERCVGTKCPTVWSRSDADSPNNCGGGFAPAESYIVHQRGADWDGVDGEAELFGHEYRLAERLTPYPAPGSAAPGTIRTLHDQSVVLQCCPANPLRVVRPGAFIDMKVCADPCDAADGLCPVTLADRTDATTFGACKTVSQRWLISTDRCDLQVVEAGWRDPHAPHDLTPAADDRRADDKRVFNLYYRAAWTCGDAFCDAGEADSCATDCSPP